MSLKHALELLKIARDTVKIKEGPFSKGRHCLTIENDCLILTLNNGIEFKDFLLEEKDLLKDPQNLMLEILNFLEEASINIREMN